MTPIFQTNPDGSCEIRERTEREEVCEALREAVSACARSAARTFLDPESACTFPELAAQLDDEDFPDLAAAIREGIEAGRKEGALEKRALPVVSLDTKNEIDSDLVWLPCSGSSNADHPTTPPPTDEASMHIANARAIDALSDEEYAAHRGQYAVVKDGVIQGYHTLNRDAILWAQRNCPACSFSVQRVERLTPPPADEGFTLETLCHECARPSEFVGIEEDAAVYECAGEIGTDGVRRYHRLYIGGEHARQAARYLAEQEELTKPAPAPHKAQGEKEVGGWKSGSSLR